MSSSYFDSLSLIEREITETPPVEFYNRIIALYEPRDKSGKKTKISIQGKAEKSPTKKRLGLYRCRYVTALGERTFEFEFEKSKILSTEIFRSGARELEVSEKALREFLLGKKKFSVDETKSDRLDENEGAKEP